MLTNSDRQEAVVTAARTWVGTPFRHQGRMKGSGVDCWNLVRCVGEETGYLHIAPQEFKSFEGYKRVPADGLLTKALDTFLINSWSIDAINHLPGYVALIKRRLGEDPKHCAIIAKHKDRLTLIHSAENYGGCQEHTLTQWWLARIVRLYRYPY